MSVLEEVIFSYFIECSVYCCLSHISCYFLHTHVLFFFGFLFKIAHHIQMICHGESDERQSENESTESDEELRFRVQEEEEEFPLGYDGVDSTMVERLGEMEGGNADRSVARDLIWSEIHRSIHDNTESVQETPLLRGDSASSRAHGRANGRTDKRQGTRKGKAPSTQRSRSAKKVTRYDNITGELTKEFVRKKRHVWKIQKIKRNKQRKGKEILSNATTLDQCVIESFVYSEHTYELPYRFPETPREEKREEVPVSPEKGPFREDASFHEELARIWMHEHPNKRIEYVNDETKMRSYSPETDRWETLPWNRPSEWFLDISKLIEDDRLCIMQMLYEVTIKPYKEIIESLPLDT